MNGEKREALRAKKADESDEGSDLNLFKIKTLCMLMCFNRSFLSPPHLEYGSSAEEIHLM